MNSRMKACVAVTLLALSALCAFAPVAEATAIPTGAWTIISSSGFTGTLQITAVDPSGVMNLSAFGNPTIGFYDSATNSILFTRQFGVNLDTVQQYVGNLVIKSVSPGVCTFALTGSFTGYGPSGGTAASHNFGWVAFINGAC